MSNDMRYLVSMNRLGFVSDFREDLFELYKEKSPLPVIYPEKIGYIGDKMIIDREYVPPSNALIFNSMGSDFGLPEFFSRSGYIVDAMSLAHPLTQNKPLMFKILSDMNYPLPEYSNKPYTSDFNIVHTNIGIEVTSKPLQAGASRFIYRPSTKMFVKGYVVYFYLFEPIIVHKALMASSMRFLAKSDKFMESYKFETYDAVMTENLERNTLNEEYLGEIPDISPAYLYQLQKVVEATQLTSCQVILGLNNVDDGIIEVIDIDQTYHPLSRKILGTSDFYVCLEQRFKKFMRLE